MLQRTDGLGVDKWDSKVLVPFRYAGLLLGLRNGHRNDCRFGWRRELLAERVDLADGFLELVRYCER